MELFSLTGVKRVLIVKRGDTNEKNRSDYSDCLMHVHILRMFSETTVKSGYRFP